MDGNSLPEIQAFLQRVSEMNEDTAYDSSDEHLVNAIIELVRAQGHTSIVEELDQPFVHPMITVQKWVEELKEIVNDEIIRKSA